GQADVDDRAKHIVYPAAAVAGDETDDETDGRSNESRDQPDDQGGAGAVHQIGNDALAFIVGTEDEGAAAPRLVVQPADGGIRAGRDDQWPDQRDQDYEGDQRGGYPKSR